LDIPRRQLRQSAPAGQRQLSGIAITEQTSLPLPLDPQILGGPVYQGALD
jgi:hypothetical protein